MTVITATQTAFDDAAEAFRDYDQHTRTCSWCRDALRIPELCTDGQHLTLNAATQLEPLGHTPAAPLSPGTAELFEQAVRDQVRTELHWFADRIEAGQPDRADVRRDAFYIREAGDAAQKGPGRRFRAMCLDEPTTRHMDEIARLRAAQEEEQVLRTVAEEWADTLAYYVAPPEVIGTRGVEGQFPWGDALDLMTPAADVTALRAALLAQDADVPAADTCDHWTVRRAQEIRSLVNRVANGEERHQPVEDTLLLDAALDLQLRVDQLERRIRDLEADAAQAAPDRMAVLRPEFRECASLEAIKAAHRRARLNRTRWTTRVADLEELRDQRTAQIVAGTWPGSLPAADASEVAPPVELCTQNRTSRYLYLTDPVYLGEHYRPTDGAACVYCGTSTTSDTAVVPTYVHNADSVNRNLVKHLVHPDDPSRTWCPHAFRATPPMTPEDAALRTVCGGCRRAATSQD